MMGPIYQNGFLMTLPSARDFPATAQNSRDLLVTVLNNHDFLVMAPDVLESGSVAAPVVGHELLAIDFVMVQELAMVVMELIIVTVSISLVSKFLLPQALKKLPSTFPEVARPPIFASVTEPPFLPTISIHSHTESNSTSPVPGPFMY